MRARLPSRKLGWTTSRLFRAVGKYQQMGNLRVLDEFHEPMNRSSVIFNQERCGLLSIGEQIRLVEHTYVM